MPSYFSRLSMLNAKKPSPHHHDMQGKTILAFRRIVLYTSYPFSGDGTLNELKVYKEKDLLLMPYDKGVEGQLVRQCGFVK